MADNLVPRTITTETSEKWSINLPDFLRSSLTALLAAVMAVVLQALDIWITALQTNASFTFNKVQFLMAIKVAVAAWAGDLLRRFVKSSATVIRVQPGLAEVVKKDDDGDGGPGSDVPPVPPGKP